jgi:GH25 family lysozyme M1 (1,4-beta-N-acetylmuramidase)
MSQEPTVQIADTDPPPASSATAPAAAPPTSPGASASSPPLQPDATGDLLTGIDLSAFQIPKLVHWDAIVRAGHSFVIARATYGTHPDAAFVPHIANARAAGIKLLGGYAFYRQTQTVEAQLAALVAQYEAAELGCGDIVPALDLEWNTANDGAPKPALYNGAARELAEAIREKYGKCIIYTAPGFWWEMGHMPWVVEYPIWTAQWGVRAPVWPAADKWSLWQFSNSYKVGLLTFDENRARELPRIP